VWLTVMGFGLDSGHSRCCSAVLDQSLNGIASVRFFGVFLFVQIVATRGEANEVTWKGKGGCAILGC
jgi:hypothetical protein